MLDERVFYAGFLYLGRIIRLIGFDLEMELRRSREKEPDYEKIAQARAKYAESVDRVEKLLERRIGFLKE